MDELAGLADGTLRGRRRVRAERAVADSAELAGLLEEQQRVLRLVRDAAPEVPDTLRTRVDSQIARHPSGARRARTVRRALPVAVAAIVLAVVVALPGGGPGLDEAAALGQRAPSSAFAAPVAQSGLEFPDWTAKFGWKPVGVRTDSLGDRATTTVFYEKNGATIGYTIVSGDALEGTPQEPALVGGGQAGDGRRAVAWQRDGHTCVLSARAGVKPEVLLKLAAADAA